MSRLHTQVHYEHYTLSDYYQWQGDWELIDGVPLAMAPSPGLRHQQISGSLYRTLFNALSGCMRCQVFYEIDVEFSDDTVVRPDLIVICYEPEGERITRAPELIVEIVSKSTAQRDEVTKLQLYEEEGVQYYAIVSPDAKRVKLYQLIDGHYRKVGDFYDESYEFTLSPCQFSVDFSMIWGQ